MKVEHITLGGTSVIRDTNDILPTTRRALDSIRLSYESKVVIIPALPFGLRITATQEGAAFDIVKGDDIAVTNFCCFDNVQTTALLDNVHTLASMFQKAGWQVRVHEPVTSQWLYSAIINPLALSPTDMSLAGEVELYIFEQLYLAKQDNP